MTKNTRHYKFINNETDNVIYYLSVQADKPGWKEILENTRHRLAIENGIYIDSIYYIEEHTQDQNDLTIATDSA
ncbi:MAG TPA: hypothetical protein VHE59_04415 [Mucilaginibacter sp.]|nr:hypothetical protein [Mucilaginibacter sp.]